MSISRPNNSDLEKDKKELLFQLHEQFSVNQNDTSGRFITFFLGIITLFGAYGFLYVLSLNLITIEGGWKVSVNAVFLLGIVTSIVLTFFIVLLIYQGYQHRRDQEMNTKIREKYTGNDFEYFFEGYKGRGKTIVDYIPDYQMIQGLFLLALKFVLLISIISLPYCVSAKDDSNSHPDSNSTCITNNNIVNINSSAKGKKGIQKIVEPKCKDSLFAEVKATMNLKFDTLNVAGITTTNDYRQESSLCLYTVSVGICLFCFLVIVCCLIRYHKKYQKLSKDESEFAFLLEKYREILKENPVNSDVITLIEKRINRL